MTDETHEWYTHDGPFPTRISPPPLEASARSELDRRLAEAANIFGPARAMGAFGLHAEPPHVPWNASPEEFNKAVETGAHEVIFDGPPRPHDPPGRLPRHRRQQLPYLVYPVYGFAVGLSVGVFLVFSWLLVELLRDRLGGVGMILAAGIGGIIWGLIAGRLKGAPR